MNYQDGTTNMGGITGSIGFLSSNFSQKILKCLNYGNLQISVSDNVRLGNCILGGIVGEVAQHVSKANISNCYNICRSIDISNENSQSNVMVSRIGCNAAKYSNNYSINTTTLNGTIPTEDIGPDQKNGGSMTKAEIEKAIQELGFELPGELPNAS